MSLSNSSIIRRRSDSSINVLQQGNDKDNQKKLSKSSEARKTVYERIEHQGLPRIPLDESNPYEVFRLVEKNLRALPDSAAVYVDRDPFGKPYMFFVMDDESRTEVAINKKYLREQTSETLKAMANAMEAMCKNNPDLLQDIQKIKALTRISPEARDLTAKELANAVKDLKLHMGELKSDYVTSKNSLITDKVGLVIKHLNKFSATSDEDMNQICKDIKMQFPSTDLAALKNLFKNAQAAGKVFSSKLKVLEKIDAKILSGLKEADAFLAFASVWEKFHHLLTLRTCTNISTQSYKGFQDWGAEIISLEGLLLNQRAAKKKSLSRSASSGSLSSSKSQVVSIRDKSSESSSRALSASQLGTIKKSKQSELRSEKRLQRLPTIDSPGPKNTMTQNILNSDSDKNLEALISSPRMLDGVPDVEHLKPKLQAKGKSSVANSPDIIWQRPASAIAIGVATSLDATEKESDNQENSEENSSSSATGRASSPEKNQQNRQQTASLMGGAFSQSEISAEFQFTKQQSESVFSAHVSLNNLPKETSFTTSESTSASTSSTSNSSILTPEAFIDSFLQEFGHELKPESNLIRTDSYATEASDADEDLIEVLTSGSPVKSEAPESLNSFLSPQASRALDDDLINLLSPGQPLFEIDENNQLISYPLSPEKSVSGKPQNPGNPQ